MESTAQLSRFAVDSDSGRPIKEAAGFQAALEEVSKEGEDRLLQLTRVETREEADRLLEDGRVEGYLTIEAGAPKLTVRDDGLNQTILKSFLDQYLQISATAAHILERNPAAEPKADNRAEPAW